MLSRRSFLAYTGGTALTLYVYNKYGIPEAVAAPIPGGTLCPRCHSEVRHTIAQSASHANQWHGKHV